MEAISGQEEEMTWKKLHGHHSHYLEYMDREACLGFSPWGYEKSDVVSDWWALYVGSQLPAAPSPPPHCPSTGTLSSRDILHLGVVSPPLDYSTLKSASSSELMITAPGTPELAAQRRWGVSHGVEQKENSR